MKKLYTLFAITIFIAVANAQNGTNCSNAIQINPTNTLSYSTKTSSAKEMWFKFTAGQPNVNVQVKTKPYGNNQEHTHETTLYKGSCGNLTEIKKDELSTVNYADELAIDMNATGLIPGQTYYLKIDREAHTHPCDKANCTANNSSNPATFDLAVQNIDVLIPLDFGLEQIPNALTYQQNRGQLLKTDGSYASEIKIYNEKLHPATYISENQTSFVWAKIDTNIITIDTMHRVNMILENANQNPQIFRTENNPSQTNYFLAHTPKGVHNKETYGRPVVKEVYNKIDMQFSANEKGLKMFFTVHPGGNADDIILKFEGATAVNVTADSSKLEIVTPLGILDFEAGHAYQINPGNQIVPMPWQAKFIKTAINKVKFDIRNYAQNMPLFIQMDRGHELSLSPPTDNLEWSTYFGNGFGMDIVADDNDTVYITGYSEFNTIPVTQGAYQSSVVANYDVFIGKFKDAVPQWVTYYGSNKNDRGFSIDVNANDNDVYIVGKSNSDSIPMFPANNPNDGTYWQDINPNNLAMGLIIRLNTVNGFPKRTTFFGGAGNPTEIFGITIEKNITKNIFITGTTLGKATFPLTQSADPNAYYQTTYNGMGGGFGGKYTAFIACFNQTNSLMWNTYFGAGGSETAWDIVVKDYDLYIVGNTAAYNGTILSPPCLALNDSTFPLCNSGNAFIQQFPAFSYNAFIARFSQGGELKWSSFFGSNLKEDMCTGIAINSNGDAYITGYTYSTIAGNNPCDVPTNNGFPLCNSIQDTSYASGISKADAFIAKFDSDNQLKFSTFYGGKTNETGEGYPEYGYKSPKITIDWNDNVFLTGMTEFAQNENPNDFPTLSYPSFYYQNATVGTSLGAQWDAYILGLNSSDQLIWATLLGGWNHDRGMGISTYKNEQLYICGSTFSNDFPMACPSPTPSGTPYCQTNPPSLGHWPFMGRFKISSLPGAVNEILFADNYFTIYPNPTIDYLNLQTLLKKDDLNISFYNSVGQLIKTYFIPSSESETIKTFSLENLSAGIYFIVFKTGNQISSKKFIKTE